MYVEPLCSICPAIILLERLEPFIRDVFSNFIELHGHHKQFLDRLLEIQREEHPVIKSITAPLYDAVLSSREAYFEYIPNYPVAEYRIEEEMANNPQFEVFVKVNLLPCYLPSPLLWVRGF